MTERLTSLVAGTTPATVPALRCDSTGLTQSLEGELVVSDSYHITIGQWGTVEYTNPRHVGSVRRLQVSDQVGSTGVDDQRMVTTGFPVR